MNSSVPAPLMTIASYIADNRDFFTLLAVVVSVCLLVLFLLLCDLKHHTIPSTNTIELYIAPQSTIVPYTGEELTEQEARMIFKVVELYAPNGLEKPLLIGNPISSYQFRYRDGKWEEEDVPNISQEHWLVLFPELQKLPHSEQKFPAPRKLKKMETQPSTEPVYMFQHNCFFDRIPLDI